MDINEIAKQNNIDVAELQTVEANLRKKYSSVANIVSPEQVEKYVSGGIMQHINRFKALGLTQFFGVILTLSQPKDGMAKRRSKIVNAYVEDSEAAIIAGSIQEFKNGMKRSLVKGGLVKSVSVNTEAIPKSAVYLPDQKVYIVPTDDRESWPSGKKNFNYLKPLPLEQYFTSIEGIASTDGTTWQPFKMMFNCPEHVNIPTVTIPQGTLVKFYSKIKTPGETLVLNYNNKHTKFEVIPGDINAVSGEIKMLYEDIMLSDIQSVYESRDNNYATFSVFGQIVNKWQKEPSEEKPYPWMTASITDNTRDEPLKLLIHPDMSAQFEEQSIVKVWGSLSEGNVWDPELREKTEEKEITMFVTGVYSFSQGEIIPEATTEDVADDGWEQ
jgi:hypothetical protein